MERTISISLGNDIIYGFDFDFDESRTEDEIDQAVVHYVFNNLNIEVI